MDSQIDLHGDQAAPRLEFVFQIRIDLGERVIFGPLVRGGQQGFVAVKGGEITGPRLQGRVLPAPAATIRTSGRTVPSSSTRTICWKRPMGPRCGCATTATGTARRK